MRHHLTDDDWNIAKERGLAKKTVLARLKKYNGDKIKTLAPLYGNLIKFDTKLSKNRFVRLPQHIDDKLAQMAQEQNCTLSSLILTAVMQYLSTTNE